MSSPTAEKRPFRKRRLVYLAIALLALTGLGTWYGCEHVNPVLECRVGGDAVVVAFSADVRFLVVGVAHAWDGLGEVCVFDSRSGREVARATFRHRVRCLAMCPDNSGVWVGFGSVGERYSSDPDYISGEVYAGDGALKLLDLSTLRERKSLDVHYSAVDGLAISPDGKSLAALTTRGVRAKDRSVRDRRQTLKAESRERFLKVELMGGKRLKLWNTETGIEEKPADFSGYTYPDRYPLQRMLAFSPDGKLLAVALGKARGAPAEVVIWDVQKNEKASSVPVPEGPVTWVSFSPDGQLAIGGDGELLVADTAGRVVTFKGARLPLGGAAEWIPGQSRLVLSSAAIPGHRRACMFDASGSSSKERWGVRFHSRYSPNTRSLAVSPDGDLLAAGDEEGRVYIWRIPKPWRLW